MRIWRASVMYGAAFALSSLPCIRMACVRPLFRLLGLCFHYVSLLLMLRLRISATVFPRKESLIRLTLFRMGQVFIQFLTGLFRLRLQGPCQGVCVIPCCSGSVIIAFLQDFSGVCNQAKIRLCSPRMKLGSFAPSSALGFSQLLALLQWIGQCPRGSRTVSTLCNA